jgi:hypothetical protein
MELLVADRKIGAGDAAQDVLFELKERNVGS